MSYQPSDVFETIRSSLQLFHAPVTMPGGYEFNHQETLRFIDLYYNGKFDSGEYDSQGLKKYFFNIVKPSCDIATKFIDLDTKDILMTSERAGDEYRVWVMMRDLKQWLKDSQFAMLLNEIGFDFPKYGSVVIKRNKAGEWNKVLLQNFRLDPSVASSEDSSFVSEIHMMTRREISEMKWDKEAIDELLDRYPSDVYFKVYECYLYNFEKGKKWKRYFAADFLTVTDGKQSRTIPESSIENGLEFAPGVVLYEDEVDELPYRELHWERVPGRWLGFGFSEYLMDNQKRRNDIANIKARGLYYTSLKVYQTSDENVPRNILTDVENGQILQTSSPITPLVNEERNLSVFAQEEAQWDNNTAQKTFSFDIARGAPMPSQTPLGVARLSAQMVASYFELKRENFGLFVKELLLSDIIPQFQHEKAKEHLLKFFGSDKEIGKLRRAFTDFEMKRSILSYAVKTGIIPSDLAIRFERMKLEGAMKKRKDLILKIPKGFYEGVKYIIDINITGEQVDIGTRQQTLQVALQIMGANPAIVENPVTRTMFLKMLELAGLSAIDLDLLNDQMEEQRVEGDQLMRGQPQGQAQPQMQGAQSQARPQRPQQGRAQVPAAPAQAQGPVMQRT